MQARCIKLDLVQHLLTGCLPHMQSFSSFNISFSCKTLGAFARPIKNIKETVKSLGIPDLPMKPLLEKVESPVKQLNFNIFDRALGCT